MSGLSIVARFVAERGRRKNANIEHETNVAEFWLRLYLSDIQSQGYGGSTVDDLLGERPYENVQSSQPQESQDPSV